MFLLTNGRVLGRASGMPVLILRTTGRRTGRRRATVLTAPVYSEDRIVLVASYGGDDRHPVWFLNLRDNPDVTVTMSGRDRAMRARVASGSEKAALWPQIVVAYGGYDTYRRRTAREVPVVILEPAVTS